VAAATRNELLALFEILEKRIAHIEAHLETAFEVEPEILEEGAFLKGQLAGVEGTEGRGPLFKDSPKE
jgi:hypothetical protein